MLRFVGARRAAKSGPNGSGDMKRPFLAVSVFTVVVVLFFVYIGEVLTRISGEAPRGPTHEVSGGGKTATPEAGEALFWGKGACYTCHSIGSRGSAIRAPNLGEAGPLNMPIGARATIRAQQRAKQGATMTPTDYLVESLVEPGAYVVEGFKNEMPVIWRPPVALKAEEIAAVIAYIQSQGGTVDVAAIENSPFFQKLKATAATAGAGVSEAWRPYIQGDPKLGDDLFFNPESPVGCAKCHVVKEKGGGVGPELTHLAATRTAQFILEAILEPSKEIASGFDSVLLQTKDGRFITGVVKKEDAASITVADSQGQLQKVTKAEIAERVPQKISLMPGNFGDILTVKDLHDLLAYLVTLK